MRANNNHKEEVNPKAASKTGNGILDRNPVLKQALFFVSAILGFWILSMMYLSNAFDDQMIRQGDMEQVKLMQLEAKQNHEITGHNPAWNTRMFGGMPGNLIQGSGKSTGNLVYDLRPTELFKIVGSPFNFLFVAMLGMFVLLISAGARWWLSIAGAIGYAFMTFSISSYEAGHVTKVLATGALPGILAGLLLIARKKYFWGFGVLALFFSATVMYFHYQIVYYGGIIGLIFGLCVLAAALVEKDIKHLFKMVVYSLAALTVGLLSNYNKIKETQDVAKKTMRGGSDATVADAKTTGGESNKAAKSGLNVGYAFAWSYGIDESFTTLIPGSKGGSNGEVYKGEQVGMMYHGNLTFTSGPIYIGAVFIFLFIIGIFVVLYLPTENEADKKQKRFAMAMLIFALITTIISYVLSWGINAKINVWLFDHLPMYNKFRTPMMALTIAEVIIPFFAIFSMGLFLKNKDRMDFKKLLIPAAVGVIVLILISCWVVVSDDYRGINDGKIADREQLNALKDMRKSLAYGDLFRTIAFGILALGLFLLALRKLINNTLFGIAVVLLVSIDMMTVANRYMDDSRWVSKSDEPESQPTKLDQQLAAVNKTQARVFDLRTDPFNDNSANVLHRNIGGYHPAKLARYQDLIANCFTNDTRKVKGDYIMQNPALDMMNCRYVLSLDQSQKSDQIFERPTACGNAWFVSEFIAAKSAPDALQKINTFNPKKQVVWEEKMNPSKPSAMSFVVDSSARITQLRLSPDTVTYQSANKNAGFGVFSEIYYNENSGAWKAFIDGKESKIFQVDYLLRGVEIPAGNHDIKFVYEVKDFGKISIIQLVGSFIAVFGILAIVIIAISGKTKLAKPVTEEILDNN